MPTRPEYRVEITEHDADAFATARLVEVKAKRTRVVCELSGTTTEEYSEIARLMHAKVEVVRKRVAYDRRC